MQNLQKQHPTSLPDNDWAKKVGNDSENQSGVVPLVISNPTAICNITEPGDVCINMGTLPVRWVHKSGSAKKI